MDYVAVIIINGRMDDTKGNATYFLSVGSGNMESYGAFIDRVGKEHPSASEIILERGEVDFNKIGELQRRVNEAKETGDKEEIAGLMKEVVKAD